MREISFFSRTTLRSAMILFLIGSLAVSEVAAARQRTHYGLTISGTPASGVLAGQTYTFTPTAYDSRTRTLVFAIANRPVVGHLLQQQRPVIRYTHCGERRDLLEHRNRSKRRLPHGNASGFQCKRERVAGRAAGHRAPAPRRRRRRSFRGLRPPACRPVAAMHFSPRRVTRAASRWRFRCRTSRRGRPSAS